MTTTLISLAQAGDAAAARDAGLELGPVSLQSLFVHLTTPDDASSSARPAHDGATA